MSSNIQTKRVCAYCNGLFMARTTVTRYCSHRCNQRDYKRRQQKTKIQDSQTETRTLMLEQERVSTTTLVQKELVSIKVLAVMISISERTLFRMIKDEEFPKIRMGRSLLFNKDKVIDYINDKYGSL